MTKLARALATTALVLAASVAAAQEKQWMGPWGSAQIRPERPEAEKKPLTGSPTVPNVVRLSAGGSRLRIRRSNLSGDAPLLVDASKTELPVANGPAAVRPDPANALHDRAPAGRLLPAYHSGDHLTPLKAGYQAVTAAVPLALVAGQPLQGNAPILALTFDDMPAHGSLPPGETRLDIARRIIAALRADRVPGAHGFINGGFGEGDPQSPAVLKAWRQAGFPVGNHTWSHLNLETATAPEFLAQVDKNEPLLRRLAGRTDWRWFRYPFLSEGSDPAKRDAVRAGLKQRAYRVAAVTMDFGDYAWNEAYARCKAKGDSVAIAGLERSFLDAARVDALRARAMSRGALGRDIPYVLLLHLGGFDARVMPRLLALYRELGFRFAPLAKAQADPFYDAANNLSLPGPSSRLDAAASAAGVPVPPRAPLPDASVCAS